METSGVDVQRDFPFLHSLVTKKLVSTPAFPRKTSDMIIYTLQKRLFAFNYWSKYNDTLFDFAVDDSIAIHVPVRLLSPSSIVLPEAIRARHASCFTGHSIGSVPHTSSAPITRTFQRVGGGDSGQGTLSPCLRTRNVSSPFWSAVSFTVIQCVLLEILRSTQSFTVPGR